MATFTPRLVKPTRSNSYFYGSGNWFENNGYGIPNCTAYAYGRFWEIRGGNAPKLSHDNAADWWSYSDGYARGQTPKLGAVLCWSGGSDGCGHVAIVEQIKANGDVVYSESWWKSLEFGTGVATKSSGYYFQSGYRFQGFIYCGIDFDSTTNTNGTITSVINGGVVTTQVTANQILNPSSRAMTTTIDAKLIWQFLILKIGNPYGVAGLMGNLYHESALSSINLQQTYESYLGYSDTSYTQAVDNGRYSSSNFIDDEAGYGLAQWTYWSRKEKLYNYCKSKGASIGNVITQLEFLYNELKSSYPSVLSTLKNATSVKEASNSVLFDYESPANQSSSVQEQRASTGQKYYNDYKNITATSLGTATSTSAAEEIEAEVIPDTLSFYLEVLAIGTVQG